MQATDFDYEIVISEDCSTDETRAIVREYVANHPRIRARYSARNLGAARNFVDGYRACRGEYIALLKGDDYWTSPEKLKKQADFLDRHLECSMCAHGVIKVAESGRSSRRVRRELKEVSKLDDLILDNFICTCSAMLRKQAFHDYPNWVYDAPSSDYALWVHAACHGDIGYLKECLATYRAHGADMVGKGIRPATGGRDPGTRASKARPGLPLRPPIRTRARPVLRPTCMRARGRPDRGRGPCGEWWRPAVTEARSRCKAFSSGTKKGRGLRRLELDDLIESLEREREEGAEFLLFPRTALGWINRHAFHQYIDDHHRRLCSSTDALLYDLRDRT